MKKFQKRRGGFTLIELMIVVAIIGILAAIAIPNFLRFQLKSKSSEGKANLAAIRTGEESFFAEFNRYVSADESPNAAPTNNKQPFADNGGGFGTLGWSPEGQVYFTYAVAKNAANDEFHATAQANIDNDTASQIWHYRKGAAVGSKTHSGAAPATCAAGAGIGTTVEPCDAVSGQSVF